ncbi:hypothetical protein HPB50_005681 [Hyalomma asiaticum]|uniref:Uncharacterized protein n=1 Tax=Hyalomma asiaticum TaxID=266040 RepID=A0ACB7S460_HYAAI|nr:hypothetical protein HPB50_005681 [Hyalomma asiaticum]
MKRSKDNQNEDISENNDDDVRPPPQKVPNVLIGVNIPKRNVAEALPKLASVQVSLPQVAIRVQKPPSIWSRLWNIYSSAKPSSVHAHDGAPTEPTVHYEEATDSVGFPEERQDSPRLGANVRVQVMRKTGVLPYSYYRDLDADVVCLPYADGALSMVLIAQRSPSSGPVRLTPDAVRGFVHGAVGTLVTLHLPKFHLSTSIDMADLMNKDAHVSADEGHWPVVSSERTSFAGDPTTIAVNKPFYFVVTDTASDLILYTGRVMSL